MRIWAFLVAIAYWPGIYGAPFMPRWWAIAIGLPLVCRIDPRNVVTPVALLCALAIVWAAAGLIWTPYLYGGTLQLTFIVLLAGVAIAASQEADFDSVMEWFCAGVAISSVIAALQTLDLVTTLPRQSHLPGGLFFSSEVLGELAAPLLVWSIAKRRLLLSLLNAIPMMLCQSRIGALAAAIGFVMAWEPVGRPWLKRAGAAVVLSMLAFVFLFLKLPSTDHRLVLWGTAARSLTVVGGGLGWWASAHPFPFEEFVHSDVLQAMVELGIGGVLFIAAGLWLLFKGKGDVATRAAFGACAFQTLVSFPLHMPANGFLVALLAGHLARRRAVVFARRFAFRDHAGQPVPAGRAYAAGMEYNGRFDGHSVSL